MVTKNNDKSKKTYIDDKGYFRFSDSDKLVHVWVAKQKYPKADFKGMEVHHIDGNPKNNNKDNLLLLKKEDHYLLHENQKKTSAKGKYTIKTWALFLIIIPIIAIIIIQIPLMWLPFATQIFTVILSIPVIIGMLGGIRKV
jgi:hypothetical protein